MISLHVSKTITRMARDHYRLMPSIWRQPAQYTSAIYHRPFAQQPTGRRTFGTSTTLQDKKRLNAHPRETRTGTGRRRHVKWKPDAPVMPEEMCQWMLRRTNTKVASLQTQLEQIAAQASAPDGHHSAFQWNRLCAEITYVQHRQKLFDDFVTYTDIPAEIEAVPDAYLAIVRMMESAKRALHSQMQYASIMASAPWPDISLLRRAGALIGLSYMYISALLLYPLCMTLRKILEKAMELRSRR